MVSSPIASRSPGLQSMLSNLRETASVTQSDCSNAVVDAELQSYISEQSDSVLSLRSPMSDQEPGNRLIPAWWSQIACTEVLEESVDCVLFFRCPAVDDLASGLVDSQFPKVHATGSTMHWLREYKDVKI